MKTKRKSPTGGLNTRRAKANNITVIINMKGGIVNMRDVTSTTSYQRLVRTGYADKQSPSFSCPDCESSLYERQKLFIAITVRGGTVIGCEDCISIETRQTMQDMDIHVFDCPHCGAALSDYDKVFVRDLEIVSCEGCTDTVRADEY